MTGVTCASATVPLLTRPPRSPRPLPRGGVVSGGNGSNGSVAARKTGVATGGAKTAGPWKRPAGVAGSNGRLLGGGRGSAGARGWSGGGGEGDRRGYDIVVIDECSQIVEPMSLLPVAVAQPRRLVLVGDPMQLPPPVARARVRGRGMERARVSASGGWSVGVDASVSRGYGGRRAAGCATHVEGRRGWWGVLV